MGVRLTLLPIGGVNELITSLHNFLVCERDNWLFEEIDQIIATEVPPDFQGFYPAEDCDYFFGPVTIDGYGNKLTYVLVKELLKLKPLSDSQTNKAIWAYLKQLPREGKIVLFWS